MFCSLWDVFCTANLVRQDKAAQDLSKPEDEAVKKEHKKMLAHLTRDVQEYHMNTFQKIVMLAPHLGMLARGNKKQQRELDWILAKMQEIIGQTCSEDLAGMLCLIKHIQSYQNKPRKVQAQLQNSKIKVHVKVHAGVWLALSYASNPPGKDSNPGNVQGGFLQGYLLKQVLRHIYTSPSSVLINDREKTTVCSGNTKLHNMQKVEVEHIAYAFVQACYGISSWDKWSKNDGKYSYCDAYYHTIKAIHKAPDSNWAKSLLEWWNK
ncbi:uncharacterized protein BJ212DRAFT_1302796 [Suillus subaureus]|uniref:Uncharacterized protein n=1 Tax=Suillus subaureus TaxID=48587 RepID=A0A9P7E287_9AGAM|nr:uncharacterized protein BJ212DRAFT_1302796 [Suillus subaureus]KAG1808896.1 hypothetical protein BJ212DRAFT_1302796 [Suillus subaureus]